MQLEGPKLQELDSSLNNKKNNEKKDHFEVNEANITNGINKTFQKASEICKNMPHPSIPNVTCEEIFDVLPNLSLFGNE